MMSNNHSLTKQIMGYSDKLTVRPGEEIDFKVSADSGLPYTAQLVRLINGDCHSEAAGFKEIDIEADINGDYTGRRQSVYPGSCIIVDKTEALEKTDEFTLLLSFMPTTPELAKQHLISRWDDTTQSGWSLQLYEGNLLFSIRDANGEGTTLRSTHKINSTQWYRGVLRFSRPQRLLSISIAALAGDGLSASENYHEEIESSIACDIKAIKTPLLIAAAYGGYSAEEQLIPADSFNGRIHSPTIYQGILTPELTESMSSRRLVCANHKLIAHWDFSSGIGTTQIEDQSSNRMHGKTCHLPLRALKSPHWDGSTFEWWQSPDQYAAIHFHRDDLYDCGWATDIAFQIPDALPSGVYALRLQQAKSHSSVDEEYLPFFVAAPQNKAVNTVAVHIPTFTYLAYGNCLLVSRDALAYLCRLLDVTEDEYLKDGILTGPGTAQYVRFMHQLEGLFGNSTYDYHTDGSPIHYSSWLRPLFNFRPKSLLWTLNADLLLIDWLEHKGIGYDIITDDLLQQEGLSLLQKYRLVISGNHPEYVTTNQLDAITAYTGQGGRYMYLGGNGYYWRTTEHRTLPGVIEVRRGRAGTATWLSDVGEAGLEFSAESGGIWKELGRPPQRQFGVGFIANGNASSYYRVCPGVRASRAAFIVDGIEEDVIGDFGLFGGGAAGQEIDQTNPDYGTPQNAIIVARSENHAPEMAYALEEKNYGKQEEDCRKKTYAEIVFFETQEGGGVFSVGSMAWVGSLNHNHYDNNISKITENVLRRFCEPAIDI